MTSPDLAPSTRWPGFALNGLVLFLVVATGLILYFTCFFLGKQWDSAHRFLKNYRPPSDYEAQIEYVMRYAFQSSEKNDVIFLGDSTCLVGLEPNKFEQLTGLKAYNLSSVGVIGMAGFNIVFRDYLQHHPKPRVLVFCVHPALLPVSATQLQPRMIMTQFFWAYGGDTQLPVPPDVKSGNYFIEEGAKIIVGWVMGGIDHYVDVPIPRRKGLTFNSLGRQISDQRGFWAHPGVMPAYRRRPVDPQKPLFLSLDYQRGLDDLARLTSANGITLLIRLSPMMAGASTENFSRLDSELKDFESAHQDVVVSRPEVLERPPSDFAELSHLNRSGADDFTAFVAGEVTKLMADRPATANLTPAH